MRDLKLSFTDAYETETSWIVAETLCNACFELDKEKGRCSRCCIIRFTLVEEIYFLRPDMQSVSASGTWTRGSGLITP